MSLRTGVYVLVCMLAGAALIVFACLGAMLILADNNNCGAAFGYYGCETPGAAENGSSRFFFAPRGQLATNPLVSSWQLRERATTLERTVDLSVGRR